MLPAKGFQPGEATEQWFQLVPEDYKNFVSGDVKLSVEYLPGESGENGKITVNGMKFALKLKLTFSVGGA